MKQKNFFGVLVLFCLGICFISVQSIASSSSVVISEIGAYEKQGHEWVEIVNNGTEQVDISGWKFWESTTNHGLTLVRGEDTVLLPGAYAIITQDSDIFLTNFPNTAVQVFDSSWQNLNESGEEIGLIDAEGAPIETFTYIAAPDFSLQRKDTHLDVYGAANWEERQGRFRAAGRGCKMNRVARAQRLFPATAPRAPNRWARLRPVDTSRPARAARGRSLGGRPTENDRARPEINGFRWASICRRHSYPKP